MEASLYTSSFSRIIKTAVFAALMLVSLYFSIVYIGGLYSEAADKNVVNSFSNRRFEDFYSLPENTLDIVFAGSSHSYCSFDPENFDSALGTSSFQLGMPLQYPDATYYTVKEVFNYQQPDLIVVEVYWGLLGAEGGLKQALTLFDSLKNDELEKEYIENVFSAGHKIKYKLDIINFQNDFFSYKTKEIKDCFKDKFNLSDTAEKQQGEEYYKSKGYVYCNHEMLRDEFGLTNQFNGFDGKNFEINEKQRKYLKQLVDLCAEKGTKVVFVTAPIANVSLEKISNYELIHQKISKMALNFNVPYIDYNMPETRKQLFENHNFRDDAHMNDSGVKILNAEFINWLSENKILSR